MIPRDTSGRLLVPTNAIADAHAARLQVIGWTFRRQNSFLPLQSEAAPTLRRQATCLVRCRSSSTPEWTDSSPATRTSAPPSSPDPDPGQLAGSHCRTEPGTRTPWLVVCSACLADAPRPGAGPGIRGARCSVPPGGSPNCHLVDGGRQCSWSACPAGRAGPPDPAPSRFHVGNLFEQGEVAHAEAVVGPLLVEDHL